MTDETETLLNRVLVSIHFDGKKFGCAYFMNGECKVLAKDESRINMDLISKLSHESDHCKVLTSSQSKITAVKASLWANPDIELITASEFAPITITDLESKFDISIVIGYVDCKASLQALHALLNYLSRSDLTVCPERVDSIETDSKNVIISKECLEALQIFNVQTHPNMHIPAGQKEGLSIYKLFQNCVSEEGRRKLRTWFANPICDFQILNRRMDVVEAIGSASLQTITKDITRNLKRTQNIKVKT
jgi:DNA mismatch repair ATPase MutS